MNSLNGDIHGISKGPVMGTQSDGSDHCRGDAKEIVSPVHNGLKIVNNHVPHRPNSEMNNHSSSDVKSMKENKEHRDHKKHSSSGNNVHKSNKHDSSKHKEHSHSHKESSKEHSNKHSSDPSKHKEKKVDAGKPKDSSVKNSDHSVKHSDKKDVTKPKEHKEGDKSKKESDKHKIGSSGDSKPKDSSSVSKDKHSSSSSKDLLSKDKEKTKDKHKESKDKIKDKSKEGSEKVKSKDKPKEHADKKSHGDGSDVKVKRESSEKLPASPNHVPPLRLSSIKVSKVKVESNLNVKQEPVSDDDIPLAERKSSKGSENKKSGESHKSSKREKDDSDDEPLAVRAEKVKKLKTEPSSASSKKRKMDDDDDYDGDEDYGSSKIKKVKKEKANATKKTTKSAPSTSSPVKSPTKKGKKEEEVEVWKWWEEEKPSDGKKWKTLQHNGPVFAPLYEPLPDDVKLYYEGKAIELSPDAEEVAGFYARMLEHDYVTKEAFNKNFFKDWRKTMTPAEKELITDLSKCDFRQMHKYFIAKSEERKNMTKEEKQEIKKQNEELTEKYGFCIIDGHKQKIGNFKIEPPGLFRGRGEHPKMGMLKRRVRPEDVIINIGKEAPVPPPPEGHKWKEVRHDNSVTWLACWQENILGQTKYIMLNPSSKLKGEKDWQKYEKARELKKHAARIRSQYQIDWKAKEMKIRQRAVALYFIDKLALRAGNEKEEGETADTVGCCSLRVEHITLHEEKDGQPFVVEFDFLGKDSIRYVNSVPVEKRVYKNLKLFMENKRPGDDLFDRLNTGILNKHLNELMEGLTAKVFRTYNASKTLQEQLDLLTKSDMSLPEKLLAYNRANRAVAILCNHQRSVPKTFDKQMEGLQKKIQEKKDQIKEFKKEVKEAKNACKHNDSQKDRVLYDRKKKRLGQLEEQLKKLEVQATDKEENKQIALGTSKLNYLDPRISVAWCKKWSVPIEKIYNRTQRDKFRWAIEMAGPDYKF